MPSRLSTSIAEKISAMTMGASPSEGSSSSSSLGSLIERTCHREHLLLATGERGGGLLGALGEHREERVHRLEQLGHARGALTARNRVGAERKVLGDRERAEEQPAFGNEREATTHEALGSHTADRGHPRSESCRIWARPAPQSS